MATTLNLELDSFVSSITESAVSTVANAVVSGTTDVGSVVGELIDGFMNDIAESINSIVDSVFAELGIDSILNSVIGFIEAPFAIFDNLYNYFWDPLATFMTSGFLNGMFFFDKLSDIIQTPTGFAFGDIGMGVNAGTLYERPLVKHPIFPSEQDLHRVCRGDATVFQPGGMKYNYDQQRDPLLDEPQMQYDPTYPYNHYTESESGHVYEIDDTPSHERLQIRHRSGTGYHVNPDGTQKSIVMGDDFYVVLQDNRAHVFGNLVLFVDKDANVSINGEGNVNIGRNANVYVGNDCSIHTQKNTRIFTKEKTLIYSLDDIDVRTDKNCTFNVKETFEVVANKISLLAKDRVNIVGLSRIDLNTDKTVPVLKAPIPPIAKPLHEMEVFKPFRFQLRHEGNVGNETSITKEAVQESMTNGELASEEWTNRQPEIVLGKEKDETKAPEQPVTDKSVSVSVSGDLNNPNNPIYDTKISKHCYLRDLTWSPTFPNALKAQCGLSVEEIVKNLSNVAAICIDPLYEKYGGFVVNTYGRPKGKMRITSGFRHATKCTSWHEKGCCFDYQVLGLGNGYYYDEAIWCRDNTKGWDHILLEFKTTGTGMPWIHFGARRDAARGMTETYMNHKSYDKTKFVNLAHKNKPSSQ